MNQDRFILDMHVKGKEAENLAQIYFLKNGYHVFNNISQHGCIDLIVVNKDNEGSTRFLADIGFIIKSFCLFCRLCNRHLQI